jgi:hypothetical protein
VDRRVAASGRLGERDRGQREERGAEEESHRRLSEDVYAHLTPELVGMKRLDLHGDVVASSPHRL